MSWVLKPHHQVSPKTHWNEISGRYIPVQEYYHPNVWRKQSEDNKQASEGVLDDLQQKRMTKICYNDCNNKSR